MFCSERLLQRRPPACGGGRRNGGGDMVRFTRAAIALGCTAVSATHADASPASGAREPATSAALVTNCYKMADRILPRTKGRSAWVGRHAHHCVPTRASL